MRTSRNLFFLLSLAGIITQLSACGDEDTNKALLTTGGVVGGAFAGNMLAPGKDKMLGTVVGAAAGGGLGFLAGGLIGGKK